MVTWIKQTLPFLFNGTGTMFLSKNSLFIHSYNIFAAESSEISQKCYKTYFLSKSVRLKLLKRTSELWCDWECNTHGRTHGRTHTRCDWHYRVVFRNQEALNRGPTFGRFKLFENTVFFTLHWGGEGCVGAGK